MSALERCPLAGGTIECNHSTCCHYLSPPWSRDYLYGWDFYTCCTIITVHSRYCTSFIVLHVNRTDVIIFVPVKQLWRRRFKSHFDVTGSAHLMPKAFFEVRIEPWHNWIRIDIKGTHSNPFRGTSAPNALYFIALVTVARFLFRPENADAYHIKQ